VCALMLRFGPGREKREGQEKCLPKVWKAPFLPQQQSPTLRQFSPNTYGNRRHRRCCIYSCCSGHSAKPSTYKNLAAPSVFGCGGVPIIYVFTHLDHVMKEAKQATSIDNLSRGSTRTASDSFVPVLDLNKRRPPPHPFDGNALKRAPPALFASFTVSVPLYPVLSTCPPNTR